MGVREGEGAEYMYPSPGQIVLGFLSKTRELTLAVTAVKLSLWCSLEGGRSSRSPRLSLSLAPTSIDIRHVMIWGRVPGGQGCYRLTRGSTGSLPYTVNGWP